MKEGQGTFFDPELLGLFIANIASFIEIRESFKDFPEDQLHISDIEKLV